MDAIDRCRRLAGLKPAKSEIAIDITLIAEKGDSHLNEDGTFKGGFQGCVDHMMSCEGHGEESARKLCAYIGRKAGKI